MFSPTVSAPLTCSPGRLRGSKPSYCSISALDFDLERGLVVRRPPVVEVAGAVVLRALVVEAVADLVADDRADAAVVLGRLGVRGEERLLQDAGREADLVGAGVVVGVDGLRQHEPLVAVDRRADLGELAVGLERRRRGDVAEQVVGADLERGVVAELLRVADLGPEGVELLVGPLLGLLGHPVEPRDRLAVGREQVGDQLVHQRLGARREVPGDVLLADGLADRALDQRDAALPAGAQLGGAVEGAAVEVEVGLDEVVGEVRPPRRAARARAATAASRSIGTSSSTPSRGAEKYDGCRTHASASVSSRAAEVGDVGVPVEARAELDELGLVIRL